jgi:uncharacterized protein YbbK (DUF523 family)
MIKTFVLCAAVSLAACSTTTTQATRTAATPACPEIATGSHLPSNPGQCGSSAVRSYSQEDVQRTGQTDVGSALRQLDPSLTVHH